MESRFHCQKTKAGEKYFCVLEKMRVTISNHDICKKNNLKGYSKWSSKKGLRTSLLLCNLKITPKPIHYG
jgi:hypothetical protein